ncbi:hypothetical protein [Legionella antarctica]|nr:hypothetical protein [Legionella antarctica]
MELIEDGEAEHTSHLEVNFVLKLVAELRINFKKSKNFTTELFEELLKGGYLKLEDNGSLYHTLVHHFHPNLLKRQSSHYSCVQQYAFSGPVVKEILFGISEDNSDVSTTWIQFERHNTNSPINLILHLFDYFIHKCTGKNIGPYGSSYYTERNPLRISLR